MPHSSDFVIDINQETFETVVLMAPEDQTVVVDFWAPWCAPCRTLGPILERVVGSFQNRVLLAKVNVDENPMLSAQYGIQGIPAVKIFRDGEIVAQFVGALQEGEIRRILEPHVSSEADDLVEHGRHLRDQGAVNEAEDRFQKALQAEPRHAGAKLELAKFALQRGDIDNAESLAKSIEINEHEYEEAQGILNRIQFRKEAAEGGGFEGLVEKLRLDENNLDARYRLACHLVAQGEYRQALEEFLTVLKKNKKYNEGAAKTAMVKVFSIIGQRSPLADEYRDKLEWVLY